MAEQKKSVVVAIPLYLPTLPVFDQFSLDYSVNKLEGRDLVFLADPKLDLSYYRARYPQIPVKLCAPGSFDSIPEYNRLLMGRELHDMFAGYEFMLILQTDAIVLRDELDYWTSQPFDYVGAPWPQQYELMVNLDRFEGEYGKHMKVPVGNGGFSLRRIAKCVALFDEFPNAINVFRHTGSSEDLFYAVMGSLSADFVIPNEITASRFSMELKPSFYYHVNGGRLPMGAHAWWKYEPEFWRQHIPGMPPT